MVATASRKETRDGSGVGFKVFDKKVWEILVILGHCNHPDTKCLGSISVIFPVLLLFPEEVQRLISQTAAGNRAFLMLKVKNSPFRR